MEIYPEYTEIYTEVWSYCANKLLFHVIISNLEELGAGGGDPIKPEFLLIVFYSEQK